MSNHLAVASVTAVIKQVLGVPVDAAVTGADVLHDRPDGPEIGDAAVNIYAYGVRRNVALTNEELPVRRADATVARRPRLALDIDYLFTFFGNDGDLEPQRLLGAVASALHEQPTLTRTMIADALLVATNGDPEHPLAASDLAEQLELVRITPQALDLEGMSKLWSVFFQTPYSLSIAYTASAVLIDGEAAPAPALPVGGRGLFVVPFARPRLTSVQSAVGALAPIDRSSTLVLKGADLGGATVQVRIGDYVTEPTKRAADRLEVDLSAASDSELAAGVVPVQVLRPHVRDDGVVAAFGFESNAVAVTLRPKVTVPTGADAPTASSVRIDVEPEVRPRQRLALLLNGAGGSFQLTRPALEAPSGRLEFAIAGVPAGDYLVRVSVDGADSALTSSGAGYDAPVLTVPA